MSSESYLVLAARDFVGAGQEEDGPEAHEPERGEHQKDEGPFPRPGRHKLCKIKKCTEMIGSLKLGNVWVFVKLISRPIRTKNQLYKNPNIA